MSTHSHREEPAWLLAHAGPSRGLPFDLSFWNQEGAQVEGDQGGNEGRPQLCDS